MKRDILDVIDDAASWLDLDGVEGVAEGSCDGEPCIVVACSRPVAELRGSIPGEFHGYRVVLERWGSISAQGGR